jgi:hypothetical protein
MTPDRDDQVTCTAFLSQELCSYAASRFCSSDRNAHRTIVAGHPVMGSKRRELKGQELKESVLLCFIAMKIKRCRPLASTARMRK